MMTNSDPEGQIFLSHPNTYNGIFSCSTLNTSFLFPNKLAEVPEYTEM